MISQYASSRRRTAAHHNSRTRDVGESAATSPDPTGTSEGSARQSIEHFVLKRGHHGRYRFSLRSALGGINGEVFLQTADRPRTEQEQEAREQIMRLAQVLLAQIARQPRKS